MAPAPGRLLLAGLLLTSCGSDDPPDLLVDVRTDVRPGHEFQWVRVDLVGAASASGGRAQEAAAADEENAFLEGVRVAEFEDVDRSRVAVRVALLDSRGVPLVDRTASVRLGDSDRVVTVVLTRDCAGVTCPGAGDDGALEACLGGRCVDPRCTPETPEHCPIGCAEDSQCRVDASCATGRCDHGTCFFVERTGSCGERQWCHPEMGCVARPDPSDAATPLDAGMDAAARLDAGALLDAGVDARAVPDGGMDAGRPADGSSGTDGSTCMPGPWSPPANLSEINSGWNDFGVTIGNNGLTVVFDSNRPEGMGGGELYISTRPTIDDPFETPQLLDVLNSPDNEGYPSLAADGRTLYFGSDRGGGGFRIYVGDIVTGSPTLVLGLGAVEARDAEISADGLEIFFAEWHSGIGNELFHATRPTLSDRFGGITKITEVVSTGNDQGPSISSDGLTLWFGSDEDGTRRILTASRPAPDLPFSSPTPVAELDDAAPTGAPDVSADGRILVFTSNRSGVGSYDLFESRRDCR